MPVIRAEASADDLFEAASQLSTDELTRFAERVAALRASRAATHAERDEAYLLSRIGRGLPEHTRRRMEQLIERRQEELLSADERAELNSLTDEVERLDAERAEAIVALAGIRGSSVAETLRALGLEPDGDGR